MAKRKRQDVKGLIRETGRGLAELMREHLAVIAEGYVRQIMTAARKLPEGKRLDALHGLKPEGIAAYRAALSEALALAALEGIASARRDVPKAAKVKLADPNLELPGKLRDKIQTRMQLLVGKQVGDLQKLLEFAYATNEDTTDSDDQVEADLNDSAIGWLEGTGLEFGAELTSATVINDARSAFFFAEDTLEQLDGFEFINGDPVTEICQDLAGTVFAKDDPNAFRYTPPLHWNCKSYIAPVLKGELDDALARAKQDELEPLKPSTKRIEGQIQFTEDWGPSTCLDDEMPAALGWTRLEVARFLYPPGA